MPAKIEGKALSNWFIVSNIIFDLSVVVLICVWLFTSSSLGQYFMIVFTVSFYFIYLVIAYHFSNLLPLAGLSSLHEYKLTFEKMVGASCSLTFKYTPSRNMID